MVQKLGYIFLNANYHYNMGMFNMDTALQHDSLSAQRQSLAGLSAHRQVILGLSTQQQ